MQHEAVVERVFGSSLFYRLISLPVAAHLVLVLRVFGDVIPGDGWIIL